MRRLYGLCLVMAASLVAFTCASTPSPPSAPSSASTWRHGFVIDASSSASTVYAYRWQEAEPLPRIETAEFGCEPVRPGLGAYGGRPVEAVASLAPLIDCVREQLGDAVSRSALHLRGTAGLRLLGDTEREEIVEAVGRSLAESGFGESSARVISGAEEGIYGWLAINYLLGHLQDENTETVGALDLGGASSQITFAPSEAPRTHGQAIRLGETVHHVYSHSYLGLGQDRARATVGSPACYLDGYPLPDGGSGTGDLAACREAIRTTLGRECATPPCSLFGVYQPPLAGDFLAFSVYAYTADFFELLGELAPRDLEEAGSAFCSTAWSELIEADPSVEDNPYVPNYCFSAAYVVTMLTDGFGFADDTNRLRAQLEVRGERTNWSLGSLLYELAGSSD